MNEKQKKEGITLSNNATDELIERTVFVEKVKKGLNSADSSDLIAYKQVRNLIKKW